MQPSDIHFAAVWPTAHDGTGRKVVVPFQCSLAEASKAVGSLATERKPNFAPPAVTAIETSALGSFCVFSTPTSIPSALIVVGTKSWSCAPSVFAFIRRVQADLARDPADFGYWQLRHLALRPEAVTAVTPGVDDGSYAMPPRLFEERDWGDEESETWEDDDMWSGTVGADDSARAPSAPESPKCAPPADVPELQRSDELLPGLSLRGDSQADAAPPMENIEPPDVSATRCPSHGPGASQVPVTPPDFIDNSLMAQQPQHPPQQSQQPQYPARAGIELSPVIVDRRTPPSAGKGGEGSPLVPTQADASLGPDVLIPAADVQAGSPSLLGVGASAHSADDEASRSQSPAAAYVPMLEKPAGEAQLRAAAAAAGASGGGASIAVIAPPSAAPAGTGVAVADVTASPVGEDGASADVAASTAMTVSAAVSEDLAYAHRGSVLQSYAITGSVLVAASPGARARLRVTDRQGHIATSTTNTAVAAENTASSIPPTREYLCKAGAEQPAGEPPKFLPTLMYRCSSAVKVLPVRVTCRLKSAGNSVIVSAQVIVNPQLKQPLSGVSVLVNLPFTPSNEKGDVQSEPPAMLKADRRMLEWVLPSKMKPGGKQVTQARLSVEEGQVRTAAIPQTAPAMVRCHLEDSMFSAVELEMAAMARERGQDVPGKVMKRCRVQCKQQG
eukprot:g13082.t1